MDYSKQGFDTVVCIASGPSLTDEQVSLVKGSGHKVIAVNDNFRKAPWADIVFACDLIWWRDKYEHALKVCHGHTEFWTLKGVFSHFLRRHTLSPVLKDLNEVEYVRDEGLYDDKVFHGGNSGFISINLAYLFGAKKIILIGYDHKHADNGKRHWFGDHDPKVYRTNADHIDLWLPKLDQLVSSLTEAGVDVVNCSLDTAITSIRKSTLEQEL